MIETKSNNNLNIRPYKFTKHSMFSKVVKKPTVVIPVFPGTNCEYDSKRAFEKAGAEVAAAAFVIELDPLKGKEKIEATGVEVISMLNYDLD